MTQTLFAVPMTCEGCVKAVSDALYRLPGIAKVEAQLEDQLVSVKGTGTYDLFRDAKEQFPNVAGSGVAISCPLLRVRLANAV